MIMIFGPAGAGKSTQGALLAKRVKGKALSVGQICREKFQKYTKNAEMVPEDELAKAVIEEIESTGIEKKQVILDGQPWSTDSLGTKILIEHTDGVIIIDVNREECLKRLSERGRDDDQLQNWNKKLDMFESRMPDYEAEFKKHRIKVLHVDGVGTIAKISEKIFSLYQEIVQ